MQPTNLPKTQALLALALILWSLFPAPKTEAAISVVDWTHISQSIAHYSARAEEIQQKYEQIRNQIRQIEYEIQNVDKVPGRWRDLERLMAELSHIVQQRESVVYSRDDLEEHWEETFPGAVPIDPVEYPGGWDEVFAQSSQRTLDTQWGVMRNVRHQSTRFHTSQSMLREIKELSDSADGNVEVTQASNMFLSFMAEEQSKTLQMLAALTNAFVVDAAMRLNQRMQAVAQFKAWIAEAYPAGVPLPSESAHYTYELVPRG